MNRIVIEKFKMSCRILLPAFLCLLLCACRTNGPESVPTEPPIQAEESPRLPLEEQPIDEQHHDTFFIDTGGKLGTLFVTAELEQTPSQDCDATVHFTVWDPASTDEPLQTMTAGTNIFGGWTFKDANFDGYMDFSFTYFRDISSYHDHLWIWCEEHGCFEDVPEYDRISSPFLDEKSETIHGWHRTSVGGTGTNTFYKWIEWKLLCMRRIEIGSIDQGNTVRMSVQDRIAGYLAEIYQEDFAPESGGWRDAETVWYDLDYHGEQGGIYDIFRQQPIDDFHDAFLVDTRGDLGTLLVTAELVAEGKNEFGARDITFSVWNPAEMEAPIQILAEEIMMGVAPRFHDVVDANFDGFQDFGYLYHMGNQPSYWHYWLWDEEQTQFIYCPSLVYISSPAFDADRQIVTGWNRGSAASGSKTYYRWMDEALVLVREINHEFLSEDIEWAAVEDLIDGQMVEVYRGECKRGTPEYVVMEKWYDLDYHGEP